MHHSPELPATSQEAYLSLGFGVCGGVYFPQPQPPSICLKSFPKAANRPFQDLAARSIHSWKRVSCCVGEARPRPGVPGLRDNSGGGSPGDGERLQGGPRFVALELGPLRDRDTACGFPGASEGDGDDTAAPVPSGGGDTVTLAACALVGPLGAAAPARHPLGRVATKRGPGPSPRGPCWTESTLAGGSPLPGPRPGGGTAPVGGRPERQVLPLRCHHRPPHLDAERGPRAERAARVGRPLPWTPETGRGGARPGTAPPAPPLPASGAPLPRLPGTAAFPSPPFK